MSGEKTEEATQKKIEDSVEKGQVAVSKDVQALMKLIFFYAFLFLLLDDIGARIEQDITVLIANVFKHDSDWAELVQIMFEMFVYLLIPLVGVSVLVSMASTWIQTGFVFAPKAIIPSFKKMNFVQNIKGMFSKKSLIQLFLSVIKVAVLFFVAWQIMLKYSTEVIMSYRGGIDALLLLLVYLLKIMIFSSLAVFIVLSITDWIAVFIDHKKNLRMSKNEVKDERKQQDGDPLMKGYRKNLHLNLINSSLSKVSSAKVVVANPTHISVALDYEPGKHDIPFILAMGQDEDAMLIRKEADKAGIPIIRSVQLARQLYAECDEDEYIKEQHLKMAAEVFKIVLSLTPKSHEADPDSGQPNRTTS